MCIYIYIYIYIYTLIFARYLTAHTILGYFKSATINSLLLIYLAYFLLDILAIDSYACQLHLMAKTWHILANLKSEHKIFFRHTCLIMSGLT